MPSPANTKGIVLNTHQENPAINSMAKSRLRLYYAELGYKPCWKCMSAKEVRFFGVHKSNADGMRSSCLNCSCQETREWQKRNHDKWVASKKKRRIRDKTKINEYNREWRVKNKARVVEYNAKYKASNKHRTNAIQAVRYAMLAGLMTRPDECSVCHKKCKIEGHHRDYSRKLDVTWLCRSCHLTEHARLNREKKRPEQKSLF